MRKNIEKIERTQHRATKCLPNIRNLPYKARLKHLKLPTSSYRRQRKDIVEVNNKHQYTHCSICPDIHMKYTLQIHTRGHNRRFTVSHTQRSNTHFLENRIISTWNNFTHETVNSKPN